MAAQQRQRRAVDIRDAAQVHVYLSAPDGQVWTWGPDDASQRITGSALDFCLLVTQRRNPADLNVHAVGTDAEQWIPIAQAFAGPPGEGRAPGSAHPRAAQPEPA